MLGGGRGIVRGGGGWVRDHSVRLDLRRTATPATHHAIAAALNSEVDAGMHGIVELTRAYRITILYLVRHAALCPVGLGRKGKLPGQRAVSRRGEHGLPEHAPKRIRQLGVRDWAAQFELAHLGFERLNAVEPLARPTVHGVLEVRVDVIGEVAHDAVRAGARHLACNRLYANLDYLVD